LVYDRVEIFQVMTARQDHAGCHHQMFGFRSITN
jgi:hypothetical protein